MIYLNNAATSFPKPPNVIKAIEEFLKHPYLSHGRSGIEREVIDVAISARKNLSEIFNADYKRIFFTSGSTESLNLAIFGLDLNGKHVIATQSEHNSVIRPLKTLEREGKIELSFAQCDKYGIVEFESIEREFRENTALVVINHCSNVTGAVQDIKSIAELAHKKNAIILVDASQSAGNIEIRCSYWDIDLLAFTGHKCLYGLQGIGGIYISEKCKIKPLKYGGTGSRSNYLYQPEELPYFYEAGTQNMVGILSLLEGTNFILETGMENIKAKKTKLVKKILDEFAAIPKIKIYNPENNFCYSNVCFNIGEMVPEEVNYILDSSYDIVVRSGIHCAPLLMEPLGVSPWGTVRVSPSYFTTEGEIDVFINAVKEIASLF
jgi:cysteine desulfurase/selenocysteine lyase